MELQAAENIVAHAINTRLTRLIVCQRHLTQPDGHRGATVAQPQKIDRNVARVGVIGHAAEISNCDAVRP
jgi:hypothetical protein